MNKKLKIGCHISFANGYLAMAKDALSIDANDFQYFSRNPRGGSVKAFDKADADAMLKLTDANHFAPFLVHAPYTFNPASADPKLRIFAETAMRDDLKRQENIPNSLYNFHPGSHVSQGIETGTEFIVKLLNDVLWKDMHTQVLLETMSGKGSEVGSKFEEIKTIIDNVELGDQLGVCLDTCHIFSAGYDIVNHLDEVVDEFDCIIGLKRLKAIHLNDSMTPFGAKKDRHAKIGEGMIGADALIKFINHPKLKYLPFYLETPNELEGYAQEIKFLRENWSD